MKKVIKMKYLTEFFDNLDNILHDPITATFARSKDTSFIRNRKMNLSTILIYFITRFPSAVLSQLNDFFSLWSSSTRKVSRQALFKARASLDPEVFRYMLLQLALFPYKHVHKTINGYVVIAVDGSTLEIPFNPFTAAFFGGFAGKKGNPLQSSTARLCAFVDTFDRHIINCIVDNYHVSEQELAYRMLLNDDLPQRPCILLGDRAYASAEFMTALIIKNMKFILRCRNNLYKKQTDVINKEGWITLEFTKRWLKAFKHDEIREYARALGSIDIRVIKYKIGKENYIVLTNLSKREFSRKKIQELYHLRWSIETVFYILKEIMEIERFTSGKPQYILQDIYSKLIQYEIMNVLRIEADKKVKGSEKYPYQASISALYRNMRNHLVEIIKKVKKKRQLLKELVETAARDKEPIRKGRFFPRWNVYIERPPRIKYRLDGRRNPKYRKSPQGYMRVAR